MQSISFAAIYAVLWTSIAQLIHLLKKGERRLDIYTSILAIALFTYVTYQNIYEIIMPFIFSGIKYIRTGYNSKFDSNIMESYSQITLLFVYAILDLATRIFLNSKFIKQYLARQNKYNFLLETFNYVVVFWTVSLVIMVLVILAISAGSVIYALRV